MAIKIAGTEVINDNRELVLAKLTEINTSIADTAVDIFVYDTRKDSDGGQWRHRCQHTSWYNETLNTATRGSRKEFPAVAVIVADNSSQEVTIYDGDDPDLPMWMVFKRTSGSSYPAWTMVVGSSSTIYDDVTSIYALNGILVSGLNNTPNSVWGGITVLNFLTDSAEKIIQPSIGLYSGTFPHPISKRGVALADGKFIQTSLYSGTLVNSNVNDVAMTVLPNAPIDAATGLPVPTIAVATDGGVSVIKDDGTVVSGGEANSSWYVWRIMFDAENRIWGRHTNQFSPSAQLLSEAPYSSVNDIGVGTLGYQITDQSSTLFGRNTSWPFALGNFTDSVPQGFASTQDSLCIGSSGGFTRIYDEASDRSTSMVAYTTSTYNTGWMNGDIKLATLSDTDATNVTGSELVTNGTFDTDTSGWTEQAGGGASIAVVSGELQVTGGTTSYPRARQEFTTVVGQKYVVSATARQGTTSNSVYIFNNDLGASNITYHSSTTNAELSFTFTASSTTSYVELTINGISNGTTAFFDNISVRLAEEDRSVNGNGLQVFGTVTKSAVASNADLVAYSGFSTSNFLAQPPNSDFDIGTGTICVMTWVKYAGSGNQNIVTFWDTPDYGTFTSASYGHYIQLTSPADGKFNFAIGQSSPASATALTTTTTYNDSQWHMVVGVRDNGVMKIYVDGQLQLSGSNTLDIDTSGTGFLIFGKFYGTIGGWGGDIALTRISTTAPSPEQILKIYNDEKHLFTEGAQATLYGSSDAVTALAYDDSTNLLHVGTSAGRSVFQGLRRVDNTTNAVGTAISASNSMVAED